MRRWSSSSIEPMVTAGLRASAAPRPRLGAQIGPRLGRLTDRASVGCPVPKALATTIERPARSRPLTTTAPATEPQARPHRAAKRYIYAWGDGRAEGHGAMKDL